VGGPGDQVNDFEPGIKPSGLFWTTPVPGSAVQVNQGTGVARYQLEGFAIPDFGNFGNATSGSPTSVPAHVSFTVTWAAGGGRSKVRDTTFDFTGHYVSGPANISFSVSDDGGPVITSDAAGQSNPGPPGVGKERNGVFFS
jgi:hypothetical protein